MHYTHKGVSLGFLSLPDRVKKKKKIVTQFLCLGSTRNTPIILSFYGNWKFYSIL